MSGRDGYGTLTMAKTTKTTTPKKTAKKYSLSRKAIIEQLEEIKNRLDGIDTSNDSPNTVGETLYDITSEIENFIYEVEQEAF